ncbi:conserved hypothetical protein [groundwater metagenome]|uniref:Uncharacterized protein n=1 Tax=groundwater metagenome TaxID=717931 RepID=A0A098E5S5_9ZZZZ
MKRCTKCILPENYPRITFNEQGVCNYCVAYKERKYLGDDALKERIKHFLETKKDRNKNYDCVVGFSGGRDSTYLLYYFTKVLNLRVLAYSVDNGFIPEQTKQNMKNTTDILNVKLVIEVHDLLKKCVKHTISSWMCMPSLPMIETLCTGCRVNMIRGTFNFAKKNKIPLIITGSTPFESAVYRTKIIVLTPKRYLYQIIRNPKWIMNRTYLITQIKEYLYYFHSRKMVKESEILTIVLFRDYIRWREKEISSTLKNELNWKKNPNVESSSRGDCDIALLKLYVYTKVLGFNDKVDNLSCLIRDGQIGREEALERLNKEEEISENTINAILDNLELNHIDFKNCVAKCARK